MKEHPIDLEAVRRADEQIAEVLRQYPELLEPNPEREAALAEWLSGLGTEEPDNAE